MSCYEWERGKIKLPAAEAAKVKAAVRTAVNKHHDDVLAECRRFWEGPARRTRSATVYKERLRGSRNGLSDEALYVLEDLADKPRAPKATDVARYAPKANSRTTRFTFGGDGVLIGFTGREVTWIVPENNHAVDVAHEHPVAKAFFTALDRVRWTRGSGGQIVGNNEYNQDETYVGGGANYLVAEYGPRRT